MKVKLNSLLDSQDRKQVGLEGITKAEMLLSEYRAILIALLRDFLKCGI